MKHDKAIEYSIFPKDLAGHLFEVRLTVPEPSSTGQLFVLPAWIPGSYMIREFARHIVQIRAEADGRAIALEKVDKHTWCAASCHTALTLIYEVYAWDLSVRAAHLDQTHGFFNGTSVFLRAKGHEHQPHIVDIRRPEGRECTDWRVATAMPELDAQRHGFGTYIAADYDELIDHPVEMGNFALGHFDAHGVEHEVVITGRVPNLDMERLTTDLKKICEAQIALFEPTTKHAPMQRYVFMTLAVGEGYGGLEHRASTALICSRADLPIVGQETPSEGYYTYMGLCSHEYFHTWNVKRIKPAMFAPYDLQVENYTSLLWLFEGFTSYYDNLMLVRSGVIDQRAYFKLVAKDLDNVLRGSGRRKQSVAASSFDAWTKFYRQDENAPNAIVSYYVKGALIGLGLDLTIRQQSKGKKSLDDVMRALWERYGKDFYNHAKAEASGRGVPEKDAVQIIGEAAGMPLETFFARYVYGKEDLPLEELLAPFAITLSDGGTAKPSLGVRTAKEGSECRLANVYEGGAAYQGGLSGGDVLVALDGLRVTAANLDTLLGRYQVGDEVTVHAFRRDELHVWPVTLAAEPTPQATLVAETRPISAARLRTRWLQA